MKATIYEAKTALMRPRNMAVAALIIAFSVLVIHLFGYIQWRRFVMPVEIFVTGCIGLRIAKRISQASFSLLINTASKGILVCAGGLFVCAWIDALFFGDIGYFLFVANASMWLWIAFQLNRLDQRLAAMSPAEKKVITQSTDVVLATMTYREERMKEVLAEYGATRQKFGLAPSPHVH